ncbi:MAG: hypothetical protein GY792_35340, partial [Gammaproteobacteria bacterium]|nr:hypothetical protein [Gammaproteobacteria bacterium]
RYGAAYHPYLNTSLNFQYLESEISIGGDSGSSAGNNWMSSFDSEGAGNGIDVSYTGAEGDTPEVKIINGTAGDAVTFEVDAQQLTIRNANSKTGGGIATAWTDWANNNAAGGFSVSQSGDGSGSVDHSNNLFATLDQEASTGSDTLASIKSTNTSLYSQIKTSMTSQRVVLPPSAAIAGV